MEVLNHDNASNNVIFIFIPAQNPQTLYKEEE